MAHYWDINNIIERFQRMVENEKMVPNDGVYGDFWKALTKEPIGEHCLLEAKTILKFPNYPWLVATDKVTLQDVYIRPAYNDILFYILHPDHAEASIAELTAPQFIIHGTPGIGKSTMIPYVFLVLYRCMKDKTLILMTVENNHFAFLGDGKVYDITDHSDMREACPVHIADGTLKNNPSGPYSWRLHFTSDDQNFYNFYRKCFFVEVVMCQWTEDEVEHYCELLGFHSNTRFGIKERFKKYGGNLRLAFRPH